eukprot:TRINITY_DN28256_c0_g1_i1.p1 TRINITY_DN28256_c0_g1~~TRINITY_DN28256_c0_g1_i1.p1  ORF type:complete len:374 (+),score=47.07 TRINITY_DN28256_c0_g1_i1:55-1176(+)
MASLVSYGMCQTACNAAAVACYTSAGLTFGTITGGIGAPAAAVACNSALGVCMGTCASKFLVEASAETAASGGVMGPILTAGGIAAISGSALWAYQAAGAGAASTTAAATATATTSATAATATAAGAGAAALGWLPVGMLSICAIAGAAGLWRHSAKRQENTNDPDDSGRHVAAFPQDLKVKVVLPSLVGEPAGPALPGPTELTWRVALHAEWKHHYGHLQGSDGRVVRVDGGRVVVSLPRQGWLAKAPGREVSLPHQLLEPILDGQAEADRLAAVNTVPASTVEGLVNKAVIAPESASLQHAQRHSDSKSQPQIAAPVVKSMQMMCQSTLDAAKSNKAWSRTVVRTGNTQTLLAGDGWNALASIARRLKSRF